MVNDFSAKNKYVNDIIRVVLDATSKETQDVGVMISVVKDQEAPITFGYGDQFLTTVALASEVNCLAQSCNTTPKEIMEDVKSMLEDIGIYDKRLNG